MVQEKKTEMGVLMKAKWIILLVVAVLAIILLVIFLMSNLETKKLNDAARKQNGGSYVRLSKGFTHYALEGPGNGQVVVLVHGGTIPMFTWDELSPALMAAGFRVLRYDMFGRGFSDRPKVEYDRALYLDQLVELFDKLQIYTPVDLVGYSFGGAIAVNFTAHYPDRVRKVALISPVVYNYPTPAVLRLPVIGKFLGRVIGVRKILDRADASYRSTKFAQHHAALFAEQISYEGFLDSFLSMMRSDALGDYRDSYAAVGRQNRGVLLIWGTRDSEITKEAITTVQTLIPQVEFHAVDDAGHGIVFQNPEQVQGLLIGFLQSKQ